MAIKLACFVSASLFLSGERIASLHHDQVSVSLLRAPLSITAMPELPFGPSTLVVEGPMKSPPLVNS